MMGCVCCIGCEAVVRKRALAAFADFFLGMADLFWSASWMLK
jgi:hypothetical protein